MKMLINQCLSIVSCVLIILPLLIEGNHRNPDSRKQRDAKFRVGNGNKLLTKRQLHGHIIETPISEEVALIEQQPQPVVLNHQHHPSSVEIIQEHQQFEEIPRYSSHPPTDSIIATHGPMITATTPPHHHHHHLQLQLQPNPHPHLHLLPLIRPVVNPISLHQPVDVHTSTKVVEVSAINSNTGHSHRLGAFAVQPIIDHLHLDRIKNLPHHHHHPHATIFSLRGQPKSRVEMFQQQSIETLDPVEEIAAPDRPNQQPRSPINPSGYFEQQSIDYPRNSRLSSSRSSKLKFNGNHNQQSEAIGEKIVYTSLADGGHPHVHQPARLILEDNHPHHHTSPQSAALIVETPTNHHRLVELTPNNQHQTGVKASHLTRCRQNRI